MTDNWGEKLKKDIKKILNKESGIDSSELNHSDHILEELLSKTFDLSPDAIFISTLSEGRIILANHAFIRLTGFTKEDIIGKRTEEFRIWVTTEDRKAYIDLLKKQGKVHNYEIAYRNKEGKLGTALLSSDIISLYNVPCILTTARDITKRKQLEDELHQALKDEFRQTVQNLPNLVFKLVKNDSGQLVYTLSEGRIAQEMQFTTDVLVGKMSSEIFPPNINQVIEPYFDRVLQGETVSYEIEVADRIFYKTLSPFIEKDEITGIVGSGIDITERKKLITLLQKSELHSVIGQLAAGVAHEIRNPLTSIHGFIQLIGKKLEDYGFMHEYRYIDIILSELSRINHLVSEMLWLHKPKDVQYRKIHTNRVLCEILPLIEVEANRKSVSISLFDREDLPPVYADSDLLKQVFINICKNGIEAMEDGGRLIIKQDCNVDLQQVSIHITDTGPGIPNEIIENIFTPFFSTKATGTGLGLFICKKIILDMGGDILISSTNKGTTFSIILPIK